MTRATGHGSGGTEDERPGPLPPELADVLRPELPSLAEEIIAALRDRIPEYARPIGGPYGRIMRTGVEQALRSFVDLVADPGSSLPERDEVARMLGRHEAEEGRSLDSLQAAYRIGAQLAWQRTMEVGRRARLSSSIMSALADAVLSYMNDLATLSFEGYREVRAGSTEEQQAARNRLLQLILDRENPVPLRALAGLGETASWPLPDEVIAVALTPAAAAATGAAGPEQPARPGPAVPEQPARRGAGAPEQPARPGPGAGPDPAAHRYPDNDVLADLDDPRPHLLFRADAGTAQWDTVRAWLGGRRAAIGLAVPLADAADSLRWARQALALAESGTIDAGPVVRCEDHLVTLWLLSDSALADQVRRRHLGALGRLTPRQQERLTETFGAWLETRGTAAEIADRLQVHPQTVRYRIRQLERTLGDQFGDPDARFAMEMVLRVMRLRERRLAGQKQARP